MQSQTTSTEKLLITILFEKAARKMLEIDTNCQFQQHFTSNYLLTFFRQKIPAQTASTVSYTFM